MDMTLPIKATGTLSLGNCKETSNPSLQALITKHSSIPLTSNLGHKLIYWTCFQNMGYLQGHK